MLFLKRPNVLSHPTPYVEIDGSKVCASQPYPLLVFFPRKSVLVERKAGRIMSFEKRSRCLVGNPAHTARIAVPVRLSSRK